MLQRMTVLQFFMHFKSRREYMKEGEKQEYYRKVGESNVGVR